MQKSILKDKNFVRNVAKLFGSSFVSQLIPFILLPILTRIYTPEDFGIWAYFLSLSGILSITMGGNYEFSIMLPEDDSDSLNIITGQSLIVLSVFIISLLIIIISSNFPAITEYFGNEKIRSLIPVMAGVLAVFRILNYWNNRRNNFGTTAKSNVYRSSSISSFQLLNAFYFLSNSTGLVISSITGYVIGIISQLKDFLSCYKLNRDKISRQNILKNLKRYKDFPKFFMLSELMNFISSNVPILFLTNLFNSTVAGLYSIPHKFINIPLTMIGSSVSQVYFKKTTELGPNKEGLGDLTIDIFKKLFIVGIVPMAIISAYGDMIFGFVLGDKWIESGLYASLLAPWMLMVFATSPISIVFATLELQKTSLKLNSLLLFIRVSAFAIGGILFKSPFYAVLLFGFSGFVYWTYFLFFLIGKTNTNSHELKKFVIKKFVYILLPIIFTRILLYYV